MVVIRLSRGGVKKRPFYHIVVADHRRARDGRYLERIGYFNPVANGPEIYLHIDKERLQHWTGQGAQPSLRVQDLVKEHAKMGELTGTQYREKMAPIIAKEAQRKAAKKAKAAAPAEEAAATDAPAAEQASGGETIA